MFIHLGPHIRPQTMKESCVFSPSFLLDRKLYCFSADAVLPVRNDEPDETEDNDCFNAEMKTVEDFFEAGIGVELGAELHADVGKYVAPRP